MKVRAVVFIADEFQGDSEILTKESLDIKPYMLNPVVLEDYHYASPPIGRVIDLTWEGKKLIADIELKPGVEEILMKGYPAIGYSCKNKELMSISLCHVRNVDKRIKTLEEQVKSEGLKV